MKPNNPFLIAGYHSPEFFCDREAETASILDALYNEFPHEVFDAIYDKFEGHTWYIQSLLNRLFGYNRNVDMKLVEYATEQIVTELSHSYADLLKTYSTGHVRLLKAIAREGCVKEILAGDFISRHRLHAASSVSSSLKKLLDNELVYQTPRGYIIYDRFMNEWLRQQAF